MIRLSLITLILPYAVFGRLENSVLKDVEKYEEKIVIVGGGIAGVTAAKYLEEAGYLDITILEKEEAVGGKCLTTHYEDYSGYYDLGATGHNIVTDTHVADLIQEYNIETESFAEMEAYLVDPLNVGKDFWEDKDYYVTSLDESEKEKLAQELEMFTQLINSAGLDLPGYTNLDPRVSISFNQWAKENDIRFLQRLLLAPVTIWGYGYLGEDLSDEISLAYVGKVCKGLYLLGMHNEMVKDSRKLGVGYNPVVHIKDIGFQGLVKTVADSLQYTNIITSSPVVKVHRIDDKVEVQWQTNETIKSDIFQKSIIAIPQTIKNLESININLSEDERQLFSKVHTRTYFSLLFELKCFDGGMYTMVLEGSAEGKPDITLRPTDGFPNFFEMLFKKETDDKGLTRIFIYSEKKLSLEEAIENTINYIQTECNETLSLEDFRETHSWDYFPHVTAEDMGNGFYDQLHSMQGVKNTFWIGSLMNFELTDKVVAYSDYLINEFF